MLIGDLYQIEGLQHIGGIITATITLNSEHGIFKGHYPDQPVLPGACMLQMVKDVLEQTFAKKLQMTKAGQIKFLQMVIPRDDQMLSLKITYTVESDALKVSASLLKGETSCFKFQGSFKQVLSS